METKLGVNPASERRTRDRLPLRLEVEFHGLDGRDTTRSFTENISSEGFCCILPRALPRGEIVDVSVHFTPAELHNCDGHLLRCRARVVHVQSLQPEPGFVIGCTIEHFKVATREG